VLDVIYIYNKAGIYIYIYILRTKGPVSHLYHYQNE
jgi:hypothetical protein